MQKKNRPLVIIAGNSEQWRQELQREDEDKFLIDSLPAILAYRHHSEFLIGNLSQAGIFNYKLRIRTTNVGSTCLRLISGAKKICT